ncbi:f1f0 ATP synthase assembly protein [Grosmannia clavigera kw1407]|uniref:F1f0 ATP synthase assembly protein n=1 Tax=Grosmannia clavigera (strain kw1407 / UAMH 11150) TaxID=655863 RepID=F0XH61_GROCL|nr:f1f0 ATP synthase assembly protein [Grosmannia clavigera kw1407]EFX03179.1 f1f0 ATP synthase assembly protein [Grosmannia clavigera kw1407]
MAPAAAAALAMGRTSAMTPSSRLLPVGLLLRAPNQRMYGGRWSAACCHTMASTATSGSFSLPETGKTPASASVRADPISPSAAVLERYRNRLAAKAQSEGVADIEALRTAYANKITELRRKDAVVLDVPTAQQKEPTSSTSSTSSTSTSPSTTPSSSSTTSSSSSRGARPLSPFLDLEKSRSLGADELTAVWRLRLAADPSSLCAVIPAATYAAMEAAARARPQFVLPVPHPEQGAEVHFLQWTFDEQTRSSTVLFTQLAEYKLRGEFAQPHTTVTHHTDLATDCGVVLMQGQVMTDRGASVDSARWLVMCLQRFYGAWAIPGTTQTTETAAATLDREGIRNRRMLLQWFAAGDPQFSIERLMEEVEKLG